MISLTKSDQLKKETRTHRICKKCNKNRLIKFFEKPTSLICNDCKRKAKRVKRQSSKSYLIKKRDDQWSYEVKMRAGFKCEYCGVDNKALNSHHVFSRSNMAVRHDLDNGVCLCIGHHTFSVKFSAHKTPAEFIEWFKRYRGIKKYEILRKKAKQYDNK